VAEAGPPGADEIAAQLAALKVSDFLVSSASTLVALAYGKLDAGQPDEARLAIESLRALLPALEDAVPEQTGKDLRQALARLQLSYASKVSTKDEPMPKDSAEDDDAPAAAAGPDEPDAD
jgi:hypothetical protein